MYLDLIILFHSMILIKRYFNKLLLLINLVFIMFFSLHSFSLMRKLMTSTFKHPNIMFLFRKFCYLRTKACIANKHIYNVTCKNESNANVMAVKSI